MDYLSQNIKHLVFKSRLSQDGFGAKFGLKKGAVNTYIQGKSKPKIDTLMKISEYFSVSVDDLLKRDLSTLSSSSQKQEIIEPSQSQNSELIRRLEELAIENAMLKAKLDKYEPQDKS